MKEMFARFAPHRQASGSVGPRGQAPLDGLADGDILVLNLITDGDAGRIVLLLLRRNVSEVKVEDDAAFIGTEGQDEVGIHYALIDIDHEIGIKPEVSGSISLASGRNLRVFLRDNHGAGLQAEALAVFDSVVSVVEDAVEALVQMRHMVAAVEIVVDVDLPVAVERVPLARVEVKFAEAQRRDLRDKIAQEMSERS